MPLGLVDALPLRETGTPILAVWLGPALATGATKLHCRFEKSSGTVRSTRIVKVSRLVAWLLAAIGAKWRFPRPWTSMEGTLLVTVAVRVLRAGPEFTRSARSV